MAFDQDVAKQGKTRDNKTTQKTGSHTAVQRQVSYLRYLGEHCGALSHVHCEHKRQGNACKQEGNEIIFFSVPLSVPKPGQADSPCPRAIDNPPGVRPSRPASWHTNS